MAPGFPAGPWVLVVGMHRSGTSAITGALGQLGLQLPTASDLVSGGYDNPVHFESRALTSFDDSLLRTLGGSWSAPPLLDDGWERTPAVSRLASKATRAASTAFTGPGALAWKDPRLCLLLPFWRGQLPVPPVVLFVWREPLAVARSLRARQGFTLSLGLALWERYNRAALSVMTGLDVLVLSFEALLVDPRAALADVAGWLHDTEALGGTAEDDALDAAVASVATDLSRPPSDGDVPDFAAGLAAVLTGLHGVHRPFPDVPRAELPEPAAWASDAIAQQRDLEVLYAQYLRYAKWRRRIPLPGVLLRRARREKLG